MQERVYIVQTPVRDISRCDHAATWSSASWTREQAYHKTSSMKQLVNGESDYVQAWRQRTLLWTSAKLKPALFRANTLRNRLFSEPSIVYRGKHVISRHFHRSYLKANKVSKSESTSKVEYAYYFRMCADNVDRKWSKSIHDCRSYTLQLAEVSACFLRHSVDCDGSLLECRRISSQREDRYCYC